MVTLTSKLAKTNKEQAMEGMTRRDLAGLTVLGAAGLAVMDSGQARAATGADSLDALAKAKGFVGFGSCMGGVLCRSTPGPR